MAVLFKAGDRVKRVEGDHKGENAVVTTDQIDGSNDVIVKWDNPRLREEYGEKSHWWARRFRLIEPAVVEPPKPIGHLATKFTDVDGKKMVMLSLDEETAEIIRTLIGKQVNRCKVSAITVPTWKALKKIFPYVAESRLDSVDGLWWFSEYKSKIKKEEDDA